MEDLGAGGGTKAGGDGYLEDQEEDEFKALKPVEGS
jgi:hypothetical protein